MKKYIANDHYSMKTILDSTVLIPVGDQILRNNQLISLNESARFFYEALSEAKSEEELTARVMEVYDVEKALAEKDVKHFIEQMLFAEAISEL